MEYGFVIVVILYSPASEQKGKRNKQESNVVTTMTQLLMVSHVFLWWWWWWFNLAESCDSHIGIMFSFFPRNRVNGEQINPQLPVCRVCGFRQGLQANTEVYQIMKTNYFSSCVCPSAPLLNSNYHIKSTVVVETAYIKKYSV